MRTPHQTVRVRSTRWRLTSPVPSLAPLRPLCFFLDDGPATALACQQAVADADEFARMCEGDGGALLVEGGGSPGGGSGLVGGEIPLVTTGGEWARLGRENRK